MTPNQLQAQHDKDVKAIRALLREGNRLVVDFRRDMRQSAARRREAAAEIRRTAAMLRNRGK